MDIVNTILDMSALEIVAYGGFSLIPISIISYYVGKYIGILFKLKSEKGSD